MDNTHDFSRLINFVKDNYGIDLKGKNQLILSRLSSIVSKSTHKDIHSYIDHIISTNDKSDLTILLNSVSTNHTYFMREFSHFSYFQKTVLPFLEKKNAQKKSLSIWSAGCSSGEEPYTLSILLKEHFKSNFKNWDTRILATDISQKALQQAQKGIYTKNSLTDMPSDWIENYFIPQQGTEFFKVSDEIHKNVIYKTFNLMDPITYKQKFDVIFCRNVMIYFDKPTRISLVNRFYDATNNGGFLFIGESEVIPPECDRYKWLLPSGYKKE